MSRIVSDMRKLAVTVDESFYYARPDALESHGKHVTLIRRPLEWFLTDLAHLADKTHPDVMRCWIRDVLASSGDAAVIHMFTGASDWRGVPTLVRTHLIGKHGYMYVSHGFVADHEPRWRVIGARKIQVYSHVLDKNVDDSGYALDAARVW